ncbi:MAG: hypothetical protein ACRD6N_04230, partial [Pyrinomonadaceae bacterium]
MHPLAVITFCLAAFCAAAKPIKLRNQTIEPSREVAAQSADGGGASSLPQQGLFLIQLSGPADAESRGQLTSLGIELLHYVPEDAFVARLKNVPPGQVRRLPFVQWMG